MVAGCGNKCVKCLYFTFNFLFFLFGALLLGLSLWVRFDNNFQKRLGDAIEKSSGTPVQLESMYIALYVLAAIGGLLCLTGFLGCCGACCESPCLLGLFFTLVLILFVAEIAGAIYIFVKKDTIQNELSSWYRDNVISLYSTNKDVQKQLDQLQQEWSCCGAKGCSDYSSPPSSCQCNEGQKQGCVDIAFQQVTKHIVIVAAVAIGILAVELLAMIFSCILCNAIRSGEYDYY